MLCDDFDDCDSMAGSMTWMQLVGPASYLLALRPKYSWFHCFGHADVLL